MPISLLVESRRDRKRGPIVSEADCTFDSDGIDDSPVESPEDECDDTPEDAVGVYNYVPASKV